MGLRCLIVDDNDHFLQSARRLLEREGIDVVGVASTGAGALARYEAARPDVALVDIDLGGESGFDLARRMLEAGDGGPSRVILISAYDESDFADLIDESPALAFLPKSALSARTIHDLLGAA
ncbi:response regulator [Nonomuraea phyllanthi]|uniref:response regulator n=1 Tax=Nonomuraea phyllanthi TaxID=2219224 RepID=UPI001D008D08|nr:response regulator transcription factor [Nonomuraea phyllanthi]